MDQPNYTQDLAYLLITAWDVARHPDLPFTAQSAITTEVYYFAALYADASGSHPTENDEDQGLRLAHWSDLEEVVRHARNTVKDSFADGWLPKDATAPF